MRVSSYDETDATTVQAAIAEAVAETGRGVRVVRESRGLTQAQLADEMRLLGFDWHQTTVGKIEAARRDLRWDEALGLAYILRHSDLESLLHASLGPGRKHLPIEGMLAKHNLVAGREDFRASAERMGVEDWEAAWGHRAASVEIQYGVSILEDDDGEHSEEA